MPPRSSGSSGGSPGLAVSAEPATSRNAAAALVPLRGDIVDRNGAPLARTIDAWAIGVQPANIIGDKADLARRLAELMPDRSMADYAALLSAPVRFTYLQRRAMPELVAAVNALGEPGITFAREPERLYPQSGIAAQALGYLNAERNGVRGMERFLNDRLSNPALRGDPAMLSIDLRAQAALENELGRAMGAMQAKGAAGIILDVDTGEVMAMSSLPSFTPTRCWRARAGCSTTSRRAFTSWAPRSSRSRWRRRSTAVW